MREIKFRAFIKNDIGSGFYIPSDDSDVFMVSNGRGFTIYDEYKHTMPKEKYCIEQYSGINDKLGVNIYQGDIVKAFNKNYEVVFKDGAFYIKNDVVHHRLSRVLIQQENLKIIGNIHDNPKLLK